MSNYLPLHYIGESLNQAGSALVVWFLMEPLVKYVLISCPCDCADTIEGSEG